MTPLAQNALDFARECLGWERCDKGCSREWIVRDQESFDYTDLNAVVAAARDWHRRHRLFLSVYSYPEIDGYCVAVFDARFTLDCEHRDLRHALMAACVQASRKLKAGA